MEASLHSSILRVMAQVHSTPSSAFQDATLQDILPANLRHNSYYESIRNAYWLQQAKPGLPCLRMLCNSLFRVHPQKRTEILRIPD